MGIPIPSDDVLQMASQWNRAVIDPFISFYSEGLELGRLMEEKYILTSCLSVLSWEILHSLVDDYELIRRNGFEKTNIVFILSRISTLLFFVFKMFELNFLIHVVDLYGLIPFILSDGPERKNGRAIMLTASIMSSLSRSSTWLLLYFRVVEIYSNRRSIAIAFGIPWFVALIFEAIATGPFSFLQQGSSSLTSMSFLIGAGAAELVNNLFVYLAVALKLGSIDRARFKSARRSEISSTRRRPRSRHLTAAFLQDSQVFYLIALCTNLLTLLGFFTNYCVLDERRRQGEFLFYLDTLVLHIMVTKAHRNIRTGNVDFLQGQKTTFGPGQMNFDRSEWTDGHSRSLAGGGRSVTSPLDCRPPLTPGPIQDSPKELRCGTGSDAEKNVWSLPWPVAEEDRAGFGDDLASKIVGGSASTGKVDVDEIVLIQRGDKDDMGAVYLGRRHS